MDLIKRLWRGDVRLVTTFWLYGAFIQFLIPIFLALVAVVAGVANTSVDAHPTTAFLFLGFIFLSKVFILVAIWRSSLKYKGDWWWADLARVYVALWGLAYLIGLFKET